MRGARGARLLPDSTLAEAGVHDGDTLTVTDVPPPAPLTFRIADAAGHFLELRAKNTIKVRSTALLITTICRCCTRPIRLLFLLGM